MVMLEFMFSIPSTLILSSNIRDFVASVLLIVREALPSFVTHTGYGGNYDIDGHSFISIGCIL